MLLQVIHWKIPYTLYHGHIGFISEWDADRFNINC